MDRKQKELLKSTFKQHIKKKQAPKKVEVEALMHKYPDVFGKKTWRVVKAFVYNCYK